MGRFNRKIEVQWMMHNYCNFNCDYCFPFFHSNIKDSMIYGKNIDEIIQKFEKFGISNVILTGGEPFLCPNFIDLVEKLQKICTILINTNLTSNSINKFVNHISRDKVLLINASIHVNEREKEINGIKKFIEKLILLKKMVLRHRQLRYYTLLNKKDKRRC